MLTRAHSYFWHHIAVQVAFNQFSIPYFFFHADLLPCIVETHKKGFIVFHNYAYTCVGKSSIPVLYWTCHLRSCIVSHRMYGYCIIWTCVHPALLRASVMILYCLSKYKGTVHYSTLASHVKGYTWTHCYHSSIFIPLFFLYQLQLLKSTPPYPSMVLPSYCDFPGWLQKEPVPG